MLNIHLTHDTNTMHYNRTSHITQETRECQKHAVSNEKEEVLTDFNKTKQK
jgi:hypothetical protein